MQSTLPNYNSFLEAKAEFMAKVRNAKATDGIIDNGHEMEDKLVSYVFNGFSAHN